MSCQQELMTLGKPYARTCEDCGLGPCKNNTSKANSWFDCTDEQLIEEVRRRGFVIRDAQIGRKWVGLTAEEVKTIVNNNTHDDYGYDIWCYGKGVAEDIEAKLKEKNHG